MKEIRKKHVRRILKKLKQLTRERDLKFVFSKGRRKEQLQRDIENLQASLLLYKETPLVKALRSMRSCAGQTLLEQNRSSAIATVPAIGKNWLVAL